MLDQILLPMDCSALAENVLPHAVSLARAFESQVTLVHVMDSPNRAERRRAVDPLNWQIRKAEAESYLGDLSHRLEGAGVRTEKQVLEGSAAERIVEFSRKNNVPLIMLSSHGQTGMSDPSGSTTWSYDLQGRLTGETNTITGAPSAYTTNWTYDAMNRSLSMTYPDAENIAMTYNAQLQVATLGSLVTGSTYNAANELTTLNLGNGIATTYTYNPSNLRLTQLVSAGTASVQNLSYQYDGVGNIKTITDTVRSEVSTFSYDDLNRLTSFGLSGVSPETHSWSFDPLGDITQHMANGTANNYTYGDASHKHTVAQVSTSSYAYDANGNMTSRAGETVGYDQENRLVRMIESDGTVTTITYDGKGNRVIKAATSANPTSSPVTFNPTADAYVDAANPSTNYGTSTQLRTDGSPIQKSYLRFSVSGLTGVVTQATLKIYANSSSSQSVTASGVSDSSWTETEITYNNAPAVGNAINSASPVTSGTWLSVDVTPYVYQNGTFNLALSTNGATGIGFGSRESTHAPQLVLQVASATTTYYVGNYFESTPSSAITKYYYFGTRRVAMRGSSGSIYYLHTDPLGSISVTTDGSQAVLGTRNYYPFGYIRTRSGDVKTDYAFTGQKLETTDGILYYGARDYEDGLGRYLQPDTVIQNLYNPQDLNRYSYTLNNPLRYTDPTGHMFVEDSGGGGWIPAPDPGSTDSSSNTSNTTNDLGTAAATSGADQTPAGDNVCGITSCPGADGVGGSQTSPASGGSPSGGYTITPVNSAPGGIASAILIGAFAGLMPAVRASRMPPTEALRTV